MAERYFEDGFYKRKTTLDYMQCDCEKNAYLHVLMGIFSELAGDEGVDSGETYEFFIRNNMLFLITRMSARIHRLPVKNETVVFTTWFRYAEEKFFLRDCEVRSEQGEKLISLSGTWVLIDLSTHRITETFHHPGKGSKPHPDLTADAPVCEKVVPAGAMADLGTRLTRFTDLDCNHHMNNSVYTKIAMDFLPEDYRKRPIKDYVVNFNRETRLGDVLELRGCETEHGYIIMGYNGDVLHFGSQFTFAE